MKLLLFVGVLVFASLLNAQEEGTPAMAGAADRALAALADRYFDQYYFRFNPTAGTYAGFHQYDQQLEDYSRASVDTQAAALEDFLRQIERLDAKGLSTAGAIDLRLLWGDINGRLLTLERLRPWEKAPDYYSSGVTYAVFVIMARTFASAEDRLKAVIARERQIPAALQAARANLRNPPSVYVDIALEQMPGLISFFEQDVPAAFKDVKAEPLASEFRTSNETVVSELRQYRRWLEEDLKARAHGDFRLGAENYRQKLLYDEDVDIPLDRLLTIGMANLRENQRAFRETAAKIDRTKSPQQTLEELDRDHPAPGELLATFRGVLAGLKAFLVEHHIVTVPSDVLPIVQETPPFARALTFASMDTPGPYEKVAKEAFFNVTLPEPTWTPQQIEEHMTGFNRGTIISTAVHEAYPGHYIQFLWVPAAPSKVRKLLGCGSNAEGWAHYTEQMMLDEGYGRTPGIDVDHDTTFLKLRLGQLQDALLRNARFIVGIQMHTGQMTFDQGVEFFEKEGFQSHTNALRETKRGTTDPTYLVYTLGKLEILKLREDYQRKLGRKFSLEEFHNEFLRQGFPPVKLIRTEMLGDHSPVL